jgi:hypothetical protein
VLLVDSGRGVMTNCYIGLCTGHCPSAPPIPSHTHSSLHPCTPDPHATISTVPTHLASTRVWPMESPRRSQRGGGVRKGACFLAPMLGHLGLAS